MYLFNLICLFKVDGVLVHMKLIEDKLEKRLDDFKLCVKELNKSLTDISKKFSKNEKYKLTHRFVKIQYYQIHKMFFETTNLEN
jgi:uncharacterized protein YeeX (DUF496 family)